MNEFKIIVLENQFEEIFEKYQDLKDKTEAELRSKYSGKDLSQRLAGLGRFKKMAKNEICSIYLRNNSKLFENVSKSIILSAFENVFKRQPNQNNPVLNEITKDQKEYNIINKANHNAELRNLEKKIVESEEYKIFLEALNK